MKIILASTSKRRHELLSLLKVPFKILPPLFVEEKTQLLPAEEALFFAQKKAESLVKQCPESLIIGCDTLIEIEGEKIGKPQDLNHARKILLKLKGKTHLIHTAVCCLDTQINQSITHVETTKVVMKDYDLNTLNEYLEKDEPLDKAGAYAIQENGKMLIEKIEGDYLSGIGLPLKNLAEIFKQKGIPYHTGFLNHYESFKGRLF